MSTNSQIAFNPQGNTVVVASNTIAPLGVQCPVYNRYKEQETGQFRIVNAGNNIVHIGIGVTAEDARLNAVKSISGFPAAGIPLVAGAVEILRFSSNLYFSGISDGETIVYITPGKGL